jgi:hypothetical protein
MLVPSLRFLLILENSKRTNMKKSYILSLICAMCLMFAHVDSFGQEFQKGDVILSTGLGLGYWYGGGSYGGFAAGLGVNAEFSITDEIAIGPYLAFTRRGYDYGVDGDYNTTFIDFGARGSYHFGKLLKVNTDQFDPYAGAFLGFVAVNDDYDGDFYDSYGGRVQAGIYAGARWFFSEKFGAFGELSVGGMYPVFVGVTFKLK